MVLEVFEDTDGRGGTAREQHPSGLHLVRRVGAVGALVPGEPDTDQAGAVIWLKDRQHVLAKYIRRCAPTEAEAASAGAAAEAGDWARILAAAAPLDRIEGQRDQIRHQLALLQMGVESVPPAEMGVADGAPNWALMFAEPGEAENARTAARAGGGTIAADRDWIPHLARTVDARLARQAGRTQMTMFLLATAMEKPLSQFWPDQDAKSAPDPSAPTASPSASPATSWPATPHSPNDATG